MPFLDEHGVLADLELLDDELAAAASASAPSISSRITWPRRRRFSALSIRAHQVFGFFLDLDVAVAQHAERALALDLEAGEQLVDEHADHRLDADEADRSAMLGLGRAGSRMKRSS